MPANYNAIPGGTPPPLLDPPPSRWQKIKSYGYRRFLCGRLGYILCILIVLSLLAVFLVACVLPSAGNFGIPENTGIHVPHKVGISTSSMQQDLAKCEAIQRSRPIARYDSTRQRNPRTPTGPSPVILQNAVVWDGQGGVLQNMDILMQHGVIQRVEPGLHPPTPDTKVIDVQGHIVSPGLVDMHSHLGIYPWPTLDAVLDVNEGTDPITPYVRSLDAFNPGDKAIRIVASGGVTTALVLPGSANLMGGEAFAFKLRPVPTLSNEDMLVQAGIDEAKDPKRRWMKMACGENPKKRYGGGQYRMPMTRMGEAFLFRQEFARASQLLAEQDSWCDAAQRLDVDDARLDSRFPEDIELETLVALLRGDVYLNVHCYETHDLEAMIRHSLEFNFTISAFHHALDAYLVPDIINRAKNNITIATFADHWGYKKEAFQASPWSPKILHEAGIPVAFKSDHPVLNAQHLVFEAAKAHHFGLPAQVAFQAVTSVPAKALGLDHRIGSLKPGYDADVVIWDKSPLALGASPLQVYVDGVPLFDEKPIGQVQAQQQQQQEEKQRSSGAVAAANVEIKEERTAVSFVLTNLAQIRLGKDNLINGPAQLVVRDGQIICAAQDCAIAAAGDLHHMDVRGGYVMPGFIAVGSKLGMVEIPSEQSTGDGIAKSSTSHDPQAVIHASDGLKLGTRHLKEAYKGGVLTAITAPMSKNVVIGVSAAFKTGALSVLDEDAVVGSTVALHFQIGAAFRSESFPTISSQIAFIRQVLTENTNGSITNVYQQAAVGEIPIIIHVQNKDEIASIVQLKKRHLSSKVRMAIMGGAEAHLLAPYLAETNIAVILRPALCTPAQFDSVHCLTGAPLTNGTAAHVLHRHGVKVALGVEDDGLARNLGWDAGWFAATGKQGDQGRISESEALAFVSSNIADIFGLDTDNDFVVWSGSPFQLEQEPLYFYSKQKGLISVS